MNCEGDDAIALLLIYCCSYKNAITKRRSKWKADRLRRRHRHSDVLLKNMEITAPEHFELTLRMDTNAYEELLKYVTPYIQKQDTIFRAAITPSERLSATLRFLASGHSYEELKFLTNISAQSLGKVVIETSKAIISALKPFIEMPDNGEEWKRVAADFENKWNFNHCVGALGGKHVNIIKPSKLGSYFYNYEKSFSIIMMALVNANHEFLALEVGINGRSSDDGVFSQSELKQKYDENCLNLPTPEKLPFSEDTLPYVIVADDAFPLLENFMKPYSRRNLTQEERIFNYRLSRARRTVDNAFGVLAKRFKVLQSTINLCPEKASIVTLACCYLHNFLCQKNSSVYLRSCENAVFDPQNNVLIDLKTIAYGNDSNDAKNVRDKFCNYFNTVGAVPWQNEVLP